MAGEIREVLLDATLEITHIRGVLIDLFLHVRDNTPQTKQNLLDTIDAYRADLQAAVDESDQP